MYWKYDVRSYFEQYTNFDNCSVLDLGCNHANFLRYKDHKEYTGIDIDAQTIDRNCKKYPQKKWQYYNGYNQMYNKQGNEPLVLHEQYDITIMFSVITHMKSPEMLDMIKYLKKHSTEILMSYFSTDCYAAYKTTCDYRNIPADDWNDIKNANSYYLENDQGLWTFYNDDYLEHITGGITYDTKYDTSSILGIQKCLKIK